MTDKILVMTFLKHKCMHKNCLLEKAENALNTGKDMLITQFPLLN